jgi:regulatory protein
MNLLARREHSRHELGDKLRQRGFDAKEIDVALDQLETDNLLNDARYAESYLRQRIARGFGPLRIEQELQQRGIDSALIGEAIEHTAPDWFAEMEQQREKKFGSEIPDDYNKRMKQARFLQNRGFSPSEVMRLFR